MSDHHIRALDLNLLRVFDALFEERNVTRAAQRLGLTQSAVSHALNRLRFTIGDELFVRGPSGMRATPRAAEMGPRIREGLLQLGAALAPGEFTPAETERMFSVAAGSYACAVLLPSVFATVRRLAPRAEIRIRGAGLGLAEELDAGRADLAIGSFNAIPDRFDSLPLFRERLVWTMRSDHPLATGPLDLDRLTSAAHIVLALGEDAHAVDGAVAQSGLERRVIWDDSGVIRRACAEKGIAPPPTYHAQDALSALALMSTSDLVALLPSRLAAAHAEPMGLVLFDPPYPTTTFEIALLWRREHDAPALAWLRRLIGDAANALDPRPVAARTATPIAR
jgi:DNA-binding transcriptional LysR family regulator